MHVTRSLAHFNARSLYKDHNEKELNSIQESIPVQVRITLMSGWMSYFGGRKDPKATTREAIVTLRQQLQMLEKKEDYLMKKIDEELKKAKTNAISNKPGESSSGVWLKGVAPPFP